MSNVSQEKFCDLFYHHAETAITLLVNNNAQAVRENLSKHTEKKELHRLNTNQKLSEFLNIQYAKGNLDIVCFAFEDISYLENQACTKWCDKHLRHIFSNHQNWANQFGNIVVQRLQGNEIEAYNYSTQNDDYEEMEAYHSTKSDTKYGFLAFLMFFTLIIILSIYQNQ